MEQKVTEEIVAAAATRLLKRGERVTVRRVRKEIGKGSHTTILKFLDVWRESLEGQYTQVEVPDALVDSNDELIRSRTVIGARWREEAATREMTEKITAIIAEREEARARSRLLEELLNTVLDEMRRLSSKLSNA